VSYEVFARKYRPQTFDDLIGQKHVSQTLKNAVAQNRLAHAYLFVGPRGIGKTSTARISAKKMNRSLNMKRNLIASFSRGVRCGSGGRRTRQKQDLEELPGLRR